MFSYINITNCCAKNLSHFIFLSLKLQKLVKWEETIKNIKTHNVNCKKQAKKKAKGMLMPEKLKEITRKFNESKQ